MDGVGACQTFKGKAKRDSNDGGISRCWHRDFFKLLRIKKAFKKELPTLSKDPHLAIYWIIHSGFLNDQEKQSQIKKRIKQVGKQESARPPTREIYFTNGLDLCGGE